MRWWTFLFLATDVHLALLVGLRRAGGLSLIETSTGYPNKGRWVLAGVLLNCPYLNTDPVYSIPLYP